MAYTWGKSMGKAPVVLRELGKTLKGNRTLAPGSRREMNQMIYLHQKFLGDTKLCALSLRAWKGFESRGA